MATGPNGIATEGEAGLKLGYITATPNKCCTKARAIVTGADSSKLTDYDSNQLVKYEDLSRARPLYKVSITNNVNNNFVIVTNTNKRVTYGNTVDVEYDPKLLPPAAWYLDYVRMQSSTRVQNDAHINMKVSPSGILIVPMVARVAVRITSLKGNASIVYSEALQYFSDKYNSLDKLQLIFKT